MNIINNRTNITNNQSLTDDLLLPPGHAAPTHPSVGLVLRPRQHGAVAQIQASVRRKLALHTYGKHSQTWTDHSSSTLRIEVGVNDDDDDDGVDDDHHDDVVADDDHDDGCGGCGGDSMLSCLF